MRRSESASSGSLVRQAEIQHLNQVVAAQHDVVGFDVSMGDAGQVARSQRLSDLAANL